MGESNVKLQTYRKMSQLQAVTYLIHKGKDKKTIGSGTRNTCGRVISTI
jgi:hypothetical protein